MIDSPEIYRMTIKPNYENERFLGRLLEIVDEGFVRVTKDEGGRIFLEGDPFTGWMEKSEIGEFVWEPRDCPTIERFPDTHLQCLPDAS